MLAAFVGNLTLAAKMLINKDILKTRTKSIKLTCRNVMNDVFAFIQMKHDVKVTDITK